MQDYELEIISDKDKLFKVFDLEIPTVGVEENEPFAVRFKNNTEQDVEIRLAVDGTDVLTGEKSSFSSKGKMFYIAAKREMTLKAWPEDNKGGAQFVFTTEEKGVASNTHGSKKDIGIISAAVYVDSKIDYVYTGTHPISATHSASDEISAIHSPRGKRRRERAFEPIVADLFRVSDVSDSWTSSENPVKSVNSNELTILPAVAGVEKVASIGAGERVDQTITEREGLKKPVLDHVVKIKYEFWNTLREKVADLKPKEEQPKDVKKLADLGNVPRVEADTEPKRSEIHRFV